VCEERAASDVIDAREAGDRCQLSYQLHRLLPWDTATRQIRTGRQDQQGSPTEVVAVTVEPGNAVPEGRYMPWRALGTKP
jgi:hypothetical protein